MGAVLDKVAEREETGSNQNRGRPQTSAATFSRQSYSSSYRNGSASVVRHTSSTTNSTATSNIRGTFSATRAPPVSNQFQRQSPHQPRTQHSTSTSTPPAHSRDVHNFIFANTNSSNSPVSTISSAAPSAPPFDQIFDSLSLSSNAGNISSTTDARSRQHAPTPVRDSIMTSRVAPSTSAATVQVYTPINAATSNPFSGNNVQSNNGNNNVGRGGQGQRSFGRGAFRARGSHWNGGQQGNNNDSRFEEVDSGRGPRGFRRGYNGNRRGGGRHPENDPTFDGNSLGTQNKGQTDSNSDVTFRGRGRGGRQFNRERGRGNFNRPDSHGGNTDPDGRRDRGGPLRGGGGGGGGRRTGGGRGWQDRGGRGNYTKRGGAQNAAGNDAVNQSSREETSKHECPICFEFLTPPIYQCHQGHLVCEDCELKIKVCSICRDDMPSKKIRNRAIEETIQSLT